MNDQKWKRDNTPYLVFSCSKCQQFSYVKLTQKTKKCLRCGRIHKVNSIKCDGEIVSGITKALKLVKKKQGELNGEPHFEVDTSFSIIKEPERRLNEIKKQHQIEQQNKNLLLSKKEENYSIRFKQMLYELANMYATFPKYLIEIMAENYSIPTHRVSEFIRMMLREGDLHYSKEKNHYFLSN